MAGILLIYMIGGAISALIFLRLGMISGHITNLREQLEVAVFAWLLWPLIAIEEIFFAIRSRERRRIERARQRRMTV